MNIGSGFFPTVIEDYTGDSFWRHGVWCPDKMFPKKMLRGQNSTVAFETRCIAKDVVDTICCPRLV